MKTQDINSVSFNGIRLSSYDFNSTKRIVKYMMLNGYSCAGKKIYYVNNNFTDKQKTANYIREHYKFYENEFGVLFLPWSQETYILSEPLYEQRMFEWVQEMDKDAYINISI